MTDQSASTQDPDRRDTPNEDAGTARDVLAAFNAEGVVDDPGRPTPLNPEESLPSDAEIPPPA